MWDRPVIAYQYIEGYQPQAYNLTKTLSKDPAENVFTFIYSPLPENTVYTNTTTTVVSGTTPTTAESWDLDDGPVPMTNFKGDNGKLDSDGKMLWNHIPLAAKITGGVAMLGCFSVALWLLIFRRRRKDEE